MRGSYEQTHFVNFVGEKKAPIRESKVWKCFIRSLLSVILVTEWYEFHLIMNGIRKMINNDRRIVEEN